jgi:hypothetical protein
MMEEEKVIPFGSQKARELLNQSQIGRVGPVPANLPQEAQTSQSGVIPFESPEGRRMLGNLTGQRDYSWSEVPAAARQNLPRSARQFYGDVATAVANPIDTAMSVLDLGAGALRSATPESVRSFIDQFDRDPAAAQRATETARAAGGQLADRYGTMAGFRRALAEDPVSVAADFSTLLSGGAGATARIAPNVSRTLQSAADLTNPLMPLAPLSETVVPGTGRTVGQNLSVATGTLWDAVTGNAGERVARNIITAALGEQNIPTIAQLTDPRTRNMPAGEAVLAAGVQRPQFQALARDVTRADPNNIFFQQEEAAQAQRLGMLPAVTPDLDQARTARAQAADPLYRAARDPNLPVDTAPIIENIDAVLQANPGNTQLRTTLNEVKRGLRQSKTAEQLSSVNDNIRRLLAARDNQFIQGNLIDVREQINAAIPGMLEARQTFAEMSAPVNQATILNEMQRRLVSPMEQERPGQFMRVLGEGEEALIRRSTGAPRFQEGDLMRILTEEQGAAVTDLSDQIMRQQRMVQLQNRGREGLMNILVENRPLGARIPNVLDRAIMIANRTLNMIEGRVSKNTQAALERAMLSGGDLSDFISSRPLSERGVIRDALNAANEAANIDQFRNLGVIEQLTEEEQPFRAELRGMAR